MPNTDPFYCQLLNIEYRYDLVRCFRSYLEPGTLTGTGLFLDRHDLQDLVFESRSKEEVDDFKLL